MPDTLGSAPGLLPEPSIGDVETTPGERSAARIAEARLAIQMASGRRRSQRSRNSDECSRGLLLRTASTLSSFGRVRQPLIANPTASYLSDDGPSGQMAVRPRLGCAAQGKAELRRQSLVDIMPRSRRRRRCDGHRMILEMSRGIRRCGTHLVPWSCRPECGACGVEQTSTFRGCVASVNDTPSSCAIHAGRRDTDHEAPADRADRAESYAGRGRRRDIQYGRSGWLSATDGTSRRDRRSDRARRDRRPRILHWGR